jgi:peptidoglycan hydrolase-like protein with peptidoglycan-binding domain
MSANIPSLIQPALSRYPRTLQSFLLRGDSQLRKTLNGGNESVIGLGAIGEFVRLIQQALTQLGYGHFFKSGRDGKFGDETRRAVEQFQQDNVLVIDGVVGKETLGRLDLLLVQVEKGGAAPLDPSEEDFSFRPFVLGTLRRTGPSATGTAKVSPEIALSILDNMASTKGKLGFLPEKGAVGGCSWFTLEGDPYVGRLEGKTIDVSVSVDIPKGALIFKEAELVKRIQQKAQSLDSEAEYRQHKQIPKDRSLTKKEQQGVEKLRRGKAERLIWNDVGKTIREHASRVGIIEYDGVDRGEWSLSKGRPGKTIAIADGTKISVKGGAGALVDALKGQGHEVDPTLKEAAKELVQRRNASAKVRAVFKYGGRVLIVVGVVLDGIYIYRAENKLKAVVSVAGGWVGATAAASLFALWWTPADVAGPAAWAVHGVGTLVAGGVGYFVGSNITTYVYELVLEE